MFFRAFLRTLRTLGSQQFLALLIKTVLLTLLTFAMLLALVGFTARSFTFFTDHSIELASDIFLTFGVGIVGWLFLPTLLPAIAAFFQEPIADAIEKADYPEFMPPALEQPWYITLWEESKFALLLIGLNILFLPFIFFPLIYFVLNGYLIGREFFETAAARHIGKEEARKLRRENRLPAILGGMMIVALALIPIIQLVAPFIGVAVMVHLYHLMPKSAEILSPVTEDAASDNSNKEGKRYAEKYQHITGKKPGN